MQQASYLERVPLMWMLPLYLHVNQKSDGPDDDDDDEQHHWDVESQCPPQHCFSDIFTRTKQVLDELNILPSDHQIFD